MNEDETILEVCGIKLNQKQAAILAYNLYWCEGFHLDQAFIDWIRITQQHEASKKDFCFFLLYFFDKVADNEIKLACKDQLAVVKQEINR